MSATRFKLSVMMFLEFFIWGAWLPLIFGYLPSLGYTEGEQGWILGAFNIAALVAMFFSTQFADRNFAAERFLAFSQLVGGGAILALAWIKKPEDGAAPFWPFFLLMLVHSLFYVPTISIANSIAFANLKDPQKEFGPVRLWGTIGWIAAAWPMAGSFAEEIRDLAGSVASIVNPPEPSWRLGRCPAVNGGEVCGAVLRVPAGTAEVVCSWCGVHYPPESWADLKAAQLDVTT